MNLSLLFKKCSNAREFIEKSKLERVLNIAIAISLILSAFLAISPMLRIPHLFYPIVSRTLSLILSLISIAAVIIRWVYKTTLDNEFPTFRTELEGELYSEYAPFYRKRARDYIDVNAHFGTDDKQTKVIIGYKRNTYFSIVAAIELAVISVIILVFSTGERIPFGMPIEAYLTAPQTCMALVLIAIILLYVCYIVRRFDNFNRNYIGVTVQSLRDDSYEERLDPNYLYVMQHDEKLSRRAEAQYNRHARGWIAGLFATWQEALLFGILICASFFYLLAVWFIIRLLFRLLAEGLNIHVGSSSESASYRDTDGVAEASSTRLVLTGHGWNEYYEIDGRYIKKDGRLTDYELRGREIWYTGGDRVRTVAFIETDGSVGSVMYASDWDGEKIFERYEYKA